MKRASTRFCAGFIQHFILVLYTMEALQHGFILGFMLGFMSLVFQAAPCELNPLVQGAHYSAEFSNLDFILVMLLRMPLAN